MSASRSVAAFALLLGGCAHGTRLTEADLHQLFSLSSVGSIQLESDVGYQKVVVIDFFATWCFPCLQDMPNLEALAKQYGPRGLAVLAIGMDREGALVLQPFAEHFQYGFPILVANDPIRDGSSPFGLIRVLPSTVVLGRDGKVLAAYSGVADPRQLRKLIEDAL